MITLNVYVKDKNGNGIDGARVCIITRNNIIQPSMRITSGDGGCNLYYQGPEFNPPLTVDIMVDAAGYVPWTTGALPLSFGNQNVNYEVQLESFKVPFKPSPRVWAGNMCGVRIPKLPHVQGGGNEDSLVLSWFYDRYESADRQTIRNYWKSKNYTHVLLSWPDSYAYGWTAQDFRNTCIELINDGFFPCPFLCSKDFDNPNVESILENINEVLPLLLGIVPMFCVGWELSLWLSPTQVQQLIDALYQLIVNTGAKLYVHFQQGYFAFQQPGGTTSDFWNLQVGKLTGVLHQRDLNWGPEEYPLRIQDCLARFSGQFGFPVDSGFGHPFDFVALEITAQPQFNGEMSEETGDQWGRIAITTPPVNGVSVMGSGNGF